MPEPTRKPTGNIVFRFCGGIRARQAVRSDAPQAETEAQSSWAITWNETVGRRFDSAVPNMPPAAAPPTSDNHLGLHPLTIRLSDGSTLDIEPHEWPTLTSPVGAMRNLGDYTTEHLFAGKYDDGRMLVFAVIVQPGADKTIAGEMLPAGSTDLEIAVRRLAERFAISTRLVDQCLDSIMRSSH